MNDARNVRRPPKPGYNTICSRCTILAMIRTCAIPPNICLTFGALKRDTCTQMVRFCTVLVTEWALS